MSQLDPLLASLPRWILVAGKGGVGKTTCAAALAARSAALGQTTLLLSTDPARSLGAALGTAIGSTPGAVAGRERLFAMQLDAQHERDAFLQRWRSVLIAILDRGTYLNPEELAGFVDDALPGADEAMAVLALLELERDARWARIVVDTAPTGHTLRLLALPETFRAVIALLEIMQQKHRFMVQTLARRYRADDADAFIADMGERVEALRATLADDERTAVALVTQLEPMIVAETVRYAQSLQKLSIRVGALIVNAVPGPGETGDHELMDTLARVAPDALRLTVGRRPRAPSGLREIEALFDGAPGQGGQAVAISGRMIDTPRSAVDPAVAGLVRPLTIVAGKGGVGKTTVACALAVSLARTEEPVLVVSSDPAPSVADALGQPVPDADVDVDGAPGCRARQMDATMAFERFRANYADRVDATFDRLMTGALDLAHDRAVARDLLALAPPGIDELYALITLGDLLAEGRYARVIVDPAPTGHLLRLLEMPTLALSWTHRLMRLMLEYKEVAALGEAAREMLDFAKRTRALRELMADPDRASILVVANDEPLVRDESRRLIDACRSRGIAVGGLIWNRSTFAVAPLSGEGTPRQFLAPAASPAPRGAPALRRWCTAWRPIDEDTVA
ncbi:MAG TPA: ArsA family ATPase [Gemmatimonadaceae bacterium]|nr:ArsA family ATPase [Gemmatimonadaceae bacterium]